MQEKNCSKCGILRSLDDFYAKASSSDGKKSECKVCSKLRKLEFRSNHPDKCKEQNKRAKSNRKQAIKEYNHAYFQNNKPKIRARHAEWRRSNSEKLSEYYSAPKFRIARNLRNRVRKALLGLTKSDSTLELVGLPISEYMEYLESKFSSGMSWDNYGDWHIDHIKPCTSFDLSDPEQQKICFNYANTQPLWMIDNIKKGSKFDD